MRVSPYIFFNGDCEQAMNFYTETFEAPITDMSRYEGSPVEASAGDKQKIMHARINIGENNIIMVCDTTSNKMDIGSNVQLSIEFDNPEDMNFKFEKLSEGGKITMPLQDTFWGARFGMLKDKFGICWMFNCQLNK